MMITKPVASIHRVVTCFILSHQPPSPVRVAIFHRCETMPTFASYWAGISGTIEPNETPHQAAQRELAEETNLIDATVVEPGGLYVNVPVSPHKTIRVYPFVVPYSTLDNIPPSDSVDRSFFLPTLELRGTEHDRYQFVTIDQLQVMEQQCVPGLVQAFHHATYGKYDKRISNSVLQWANDKENGASVMVQNAISLLQEQTDVTMKQQVAKQICMLRPTMVPIVNLMHQILDGINVHLDSIQMELERSIELGKSAIKDLQQSLNKDHLMIATFSRSGTLLKVLKPFITSCKIVCGQSTPGNEGELFANDLGVGVDCIPDQDLHRILPTVDLLIVGADCVLPTSGVINKVGTRELCQIANRHDIPVFCCADRYKLWDDIFPPPLEADLFEVIPIELITRLLIPPADDTNG